MEKQDAPPKVLSIPKSRGRLARRLLWLVGAFVLLLAGLRMILPTLLERGTAYASRHYLGLPARVGNVDFSLWHGAAVFEDVSVGRLPDEASPRDAAWNPPPIDAATALLHFDRVALKWSWTDFFRKKVRLFEVSLEAPSVRVRREADGTIDPLRLARPVEKFVPAVEESPEPEPTESWPLEIARFVLLSPAVVVEDAPTGQNLMEFSLESFEIADVRVSGNDVGLGPMAIRDPVLRVQRDLVFAESIAQGPAETHRPSSATAPGSAAPGAKVSKSGIRVQAVDVERAKFTWLSREGPLEVTLTLKATELTAEEGKRFPLDLALQIGPGTLEVKGEVGLLPPIFKGRVTWAGLSFPPLLLAAQPELAGWLRSADASGDLKVRMDPAGVEGPPSLQLSGRVNLNSFVIVEPSSNEVSIGWQSLAAEINEVFVPIPEEDQPQGTIRADLKYVHLVQPEVRYTYPSPKLDALVGLDAATPASASATQAAGSSAASAEAPSVVDLSIEQFELTGGSIELNDTSVSALPAVRDLNVRLNGLRFPELTFSALSVQATLPTAAKVSIEGSLSAGLTGNFVIGVQELDLPAFSPYAKVAGVALDAGKVSVQTKLGTSGRVIQADSEIVLNKLGVSLNDPDVFSKQFGLPIDAALALLNDSAGNIRLTLPVRMDEDGARVAAGAVIGSAIKAAILGALSSPLKLIGIGIKDHSTKGGASGIVNLSAAVIQFPPGSAEPRADARVQVESYVKLLAQRPHMGLTLRGRISPEDRPVVAGQILVERVRSGDALPEVSGVGFLERQKMKGYLARLGKGKAVESAEKIQALYDRYVAAIKVPEERLTALAKQRAEQVRDRLVAKGAPLKNLNVGDRDIDGPAGVVIAFRQQPPNESSPKPTKPPR